MAKRIPTNKIKTEANKLAPKNNSSLSLEDKIFDIPKLLDTGHRESSLQKTPYVVLKYFQTDWQCFSELTKEELKAFTAFIDLLSQITWKTVYESAGKGANKGSLGYTCYDHKAMKSGKSQVDKVKSRLSEDIQFFELRVTQRMRVHGFQSQAAFFLVLLDKDHSVFPS